MSKRSPTTKDVALLYQLFQDGQLKLAPEFQRNSVWPKVAKAYLIDTILMDRPIPILFFQRSTSSQTGRPEFAVIDGQQRLRAIFEFLQDRFRLSQSKGKPFQSKKFSTLTNELKNQIRNYDLVVEEISGYSDLDIRDMFMRMNKYVVKLSPQELRHAKTQGRFRDFVEEIGRWDFWRLQRVFSAAQIQRMRPVEFAAELAILLIEGPQDKKSAIDLYYGEYRTQFSAGASVSARLRKYLDWIAEVLPNLAQSRYRRAVDLYSLVGALDRVSGQGASLSRVDKRHARARLVQFEGQTRRQDLGGDVSGYVIAASRQTDNIAPRSRRIDILSNLLA